MENKTSFHKFMDATNPVKIELALLDELVNDNMEAGSLLVIQKEIVDALKKLEKSKSINAAGLAKAKKGLESAKQLGDEKTIATFTRWVDTFGKDIARADKTIAQLKSVNIGF